MAHIVFYEKSGCSGNARQKALLQAAGHVLDVRDLRDVTWTNSRLLAFLKGLPVPAWFNRSAPAVKSGEIVPEDLDEAAALALLQRFPLLIRRPLMEVGDDRMVGFDAEAVDAWISLAGQPVDGDMEACRHADDPEHRCRDTHTG